MLIGTPDRLPMHLRIRARRERLSLTGNELARRAGISPSYVSLIEKGAKVPEEEVAVRIAQVLEDDPELYRAWALATRYGSVERTIASTEWLQRLRSEPGSWRKLARGEEMPDSSPSAPAAAPAPDEAEFDVDLGGLEPPPMAPRASASARPQRSLMNMPASFTSAGPEKSPPSLEIPLYPEGADPDRSSPAGPPLILDRRLLPEGVEAENLLAYRVTGATVRVATITDGSYVVVHRGAGRVTPEGLYAVRLHGRVVLARVLLSKRSLLVLPPEGRTKYDVIELESSAGVEPYLVGRVVAVVGGLA